MKSKQVNIKKTSLIALAVALAVSFGATPAGAGGLECEPDVYVENRKGASIKVLKFEYTVNGTKHVESLVNKRLAPGEEEHWFGQKLSEAATGILITSTRVQYKNDNSGAGDGYGPPVWSDSHPHTPTYVCLAGRNYAHYID